MFVYISYTKNPNSLALTAVLTGFLTHGVDAGVGAGQIVPADTIGQDVNTVFATRVIGLPCIKRSMFR